MGHPRPYFQIDQGRKTKTRFAKISTSDIFKALGMIAMTSPDKTNPNMIKVNIPVL